MSHAAVQEQVVEQVFVAVLACSWKQGGTCVAGRRVLPLANGGWRVTDDWVRPVANDESWCGALDVDQITCTNGARVRVGDIVKMPLWNVGGFYGQPENRIVADAWEWVGELPLDQVRQLVDAPEHIWSDPLAEFDDRVTATIVATGQVQGSLLLIQPQNLEFCLTHEVNSYTGGSRTRLRAAFDYNGQRYSGLSVTCPALNRMLRNQFPALGGEPVTVRLRKGDDYLLCLSLSPEFRGNHYKLVAAVYDYDGYLARTYG